MHAIILAGGFGSRLKSVVADVPKPLAPINGRPFLELLIARLVSQGVTSVTLSVHHMREQMERFVAGQSFTIPINIVVEEKPLGTGGAMAFCLSKYLEKAGDDRTEKNLSPRRMTGSGNGRAAPGQAPQQVRGDKFGEPILVLNGDSFVKVDYRRLYAHHLAKKAALTLTLRKVPDTSRYGKVITRNNIVTHFLPQGDAKPGFINAGVYVMDPDLFERFPMGEVSSSPDFAQRSIGGSTHRLGDAGKQSLPMDGPIVASGNSGHDAPAFSFERDFMPKYVKQLKAASFIADDYFIDIGVPEDYARAQKELADVR